MNRIVSEKAKLNEKELPQLKMSNRDGFVPGSRPDTPASKAQKPRRFHALRQNHPRNTQEVKSGGEGGIETPIGEREVRGQ